MSRDEEAALSSAVGRGEKSAFDRIYEEYNQQLFGYIASRADSDADGKDIAQQAWAKFYRQAAKAFDPARGNLISFLITIARSEIADYYRREHRQKAIVFSDLMKETEDVTIEALLGRLAPRAVSHLPKAMDRVMESVLLSLLLREENPPHEVIAYFLKRSGFKPEDTVNQHSDTKLLLLAENSEQDYKETSDLEDMAIEQAFRPFRARMGWRLKLALKEPKTQKMYSQILETIVGQTVLRQYYTGDPNANVSFWCFNMVRRAIKAAVEPADRHANETNR
jgi:RNA polymerase sigma factor (sigma-70 family)